MKVISEKMKKSVAVISIFLTLFSFFATNTFAATEETVISPRFSTISAVATCFIISGINSTSSVSITAQYSTSLSIKIELQKEKSTGYETIETWTKSGTGIVLALEETRLINVFANYRIKVTCKAGSETHVTYDYP